MISISVGVNLNWLCDMKRYNQYCLKLCFTQKNYKAMFGFQKI